jgi:biotin transport system substrate-specific component
MNSLVSLKGLVWIVLLAALVGIGAHISFPLGPVPITLQTLFVILAGFVLGPIRGAVCLILYLGAGAIGLPVYAGGKSGIAALFGPSGGYLFGFVLAACVAGVGTMGRKRQLKWGRGFIWGAAGSVVILIVGVVWLKIALDMSWSQAADAGVWPFLPGAVIKSVLSVFLYRLLQCTHLISA